MDHRFDVHERFADGRAVHRGQSPERHLRTYPRRRGPGDRRDGRTPTNSRAPPTSTRPSPPRSEAFPEWARCHPGRALRRPAPLRRRARRATPRISPTPSRCSAASRSSSARSSTCRAPIDNTAFFAGAARHLEGKAAGEYSRRPHLRTSAASPSASSAPSRPGTTRSRWPPGRSCRPSPRATPSSSSPPRSPRCTSLLFAAGRHRRAGIPDGVVNIITGRGQGRRRAPGRPPATSP